HEYSVPETTAIPELFQFENTALVALRESAQIHQDSVAPSEQRAERRRPGVLMTVELSDAKPPVRIADLIGLVEALLKIFAALDKQRPQVAANERESVISINETCGEIGAGDHLD